jgi:transposase
VVYVGIDLRHGQGWRRHALSLRPPPRLASWAGLTPRVRNSGDRIRLGSISHQGSPHPRRGLIQAAQTAVQADGPLKITHERIKRRRGSKVAKVACVEGVWSVWCPLWQRA